MSAMSRIQTTSRFSGHTYTHGRHEIRGSFVETEKTGDELRYAVRHDGLYDKYDGDNGEIGQFVGVELGGELGKDCKTVC